MLGQDQVFLLGGEFGGDTKPICRIQVDVPLHLLVSSVYYPSVDLFFISGFFFFFFIAYYFDLDTFNDLLPWANFNC